jgi:6-phosphogluconolactonase
LDKIVEYPSGRVFDTSPAGAGPRHLLFHPNGRLAFLVSELGNLVTSLSWSPTDGFRTLDTLSTIISQKPQESFKQGVQERQENNSPDSPVLHAKNLCASAPPRENYSLAAAIRFTPDGKSVVVSNRGENSLAVFDFDETNGKLAVKARTMLSGNWPRDFIFVNDSLALVACERSGEVLAMRYDSSTGVFTQIAALDGLYRPVALTVIR